MKSFKDHITEAKVLMSKDISKLSEDQMEELIENLAVKMRLKEGRDWTIVQEKNKIILQLLTKKAVAASKKLNIKEELEEDVKLSNVKMDYMPLSKKVLLKLRQGNTNLVIEVDKKELQKVVDGDRLAILKVNDITITT